MLLKSVMAAIRKGKCRIIKFYSDVYETIHMFGQFLSEELTHVVTFNDLNIQSYIVIYKRSVKIHT